MHLNSNLPLFVILSKNAFSIIKLLLRHDELLGEYERTSLQGSDLGFEGSAGLC